MILGKKVILYPTKEQEQKLWQSVGTARFIYNWTLARQEENYKNGGKFISDHDLRKELTSLKKTELNWLNEVSNNVSKQAKYWFISVGIEKEKPIIELTTESIGIDIGVKD